MTFRSTAVRRPWLALALAASSAWGMDLRNAVIVAPQSQTTAETKAVQTANRIALGKPRSGIPRSTKTIRTRPLWWNPDADVTEILREFSRYFLGERYRDTWAQGLLALERNWRGPLLANEGVATTFQTFQAMEREASPQTLLNWRFQQGLYRAYYDEFLRQRLIYETALEESARAALREAGQVGALNAMDTAEAILDRAVTAPAATGLRARIHELAEALYQSIRAQWSVEKYKAIATERGANLDTIDLPLNNRFYLKKQFAEIRALEQGIAEDR